MTDLKPDEKLCPYCAEPIKAAAVRCRWCRSDLGDVEVPAPPEALPGSPWADATAPDTGAADVDDDTHADTEDGPKVSFWRGARLFGLLVGALVGMLVVTGLVVWTQGREPAVPTEGADAVAVQLTEESARDAALSAATELTAAALSYKWNTLAEDRKKAEAGMTDDFRAEYREAMESVEKQTRENQIVLKAEVVAAGLVAGDQHRAQVLTFTNQSTTTKDSDAPRIDQNRVLVSLTRSGGDWRLSDMKAF